MKPGAAWVIVVLLAVPAGAAGNPKLAWWDTPRHGANYFNKVETEERFRAGAEVGLQWVRLAPDKWKGSGRDFLVGDADGFAGVVGEDLARLREVLGWAEGAEVKVVLTMLSLPGVRWRQNNGGRDDGRLWEDPERWTPQAEAFWTELAGALRGHPAVVAYDPLNEPHKVEPAAVDAFNRRMVGAVRAADPDVPVMLEGTGWGNAKGLQRLAPIAGDPAILYSFHLYEPWEYVTWRQNKGRFRYPDRMPEGRKGDAVLTDRIGRVAGWAARHGVPASRIVAAEFGCDRRVGGAAAYLAAVADALTAQGWHWAFYSFREDTWDAMDYEKGPKPAWPGLARHLTPAKSRRTPPAAGRSPRGGPPAGSGRTPAGP